MSFDNNGHATDISFDSDVVLTDEIIDATNRLTHPQEMYFEYAECDD